MENIVSYAEKNLKSFADEPFNAVDSLIFSWFVYLPFPQKIQ